MGGGPRLGGREPRRMSVAVLRGVVAVQGGFLLKFLKEELEPLAGRHGLHARISTASFLSLC